VVKEVGGTPVYHPRRGRSGFGHAVRVGAVVKNGTTESVGGIVMMMAGGNAKEVVSDIKKKVAEINDKNMLPERPEDRTLLRPLRAGRCGAATVIKVLIEGVIFVVIVLYLFLGDLRSSLIVIATLVLTPLVTFMVMNQVGLSANLMSLGGLAIAIG
jgi:cobalt-zinc-cadmium resistance protein CzcA